MGSAFYRGADCCALVFDVTNPKTFDNLYKWKAGFLEYAGLKDPSANPFVLLGNKVDLEVDRKITAQKAIDWCKEQGAISYFETSAQQNISVDEAFY